MRLKVVKVLSNYNSLKSRIIRSNGSKYSLPDKFNPVYEGIMMDNHGRRKLVWSISINDDGNNNPTRKRNASFHHLTKEYQTTNKQTRLTKNDKKTSIIPKILTSVFCGVMCASFYIIMPTPFNYISALAACGPLSASIIRLLFTR